MSIHVFVVSPSFALKHCALDQLEWWATVEFRYSLPLEAHDK